LPQEKAIRLALLPPIAAWNWLLQSEKAMVTGVGLADGLADAVPVEVAALLVVRVVGGAACRLPEVHEASISPARVTAMPANRRRRTLLVCCTR
jgi:hypothetical protein